MSAALRMFVRAYQFDYGFFKDTGRLLKQRVEIDDHLFEKGAPEDVLAPAFGGLNGEEGKYATEI